MLGACQSYGADAAEKALDMEISAVQKSVASVGELLSEVRLELDVVIKTYDSKEPLKRFRERFKELLILADVPPFQNADSWRLNKRPTDSGSPGPRAVVAYYGALWATMQDKDGNLPSPLVIDSPNQNAQDAKNLSRVMALLAERTPTNAQVILCAEEPNSAFSAEEIVELVDERALLRADAMSSISAQVLPLVEKAIAALAGIDQGHS